jgi:hypothetical protein
VVSYLVEVLTLEPHDAGAIKGVAAFGLAPAGQTQLAVPAGVVANAQAQIAGDALMAYLMPRVTPITITGPEPGFPGAARALTELRGDTLVPIALSGVCLIDGAPQPVAPAPVGSAVWNPGPCLSHTGFLFDEPLPGAFHVALRANPPHTTAVVLAEDTGGFFAGDVRIVGHVGFAGTGAALNNVDTALGAHTTAVGGNTTSPGVNNQSLELAPLNINLTTPPTNLLRVFPQIQNNAIGDPQQPAVFFGLRAVRP